jgi:Undecaprenyl-phosphate glucose phosphotransferase
MDLSEMNNFDPAVVVDKEKMLLLRDGTSDLESPHTRRTAKSSARYRLPFVVNMLKLSDIVALLVASYGGFFLRFGFDARLSQADNLFIYFSTLVMSVSLHVSKAYRERLLTSLYSQLSTLVAGVMGGLSLILLFGYLSSTLSAYSRLWFMFSSGASFALLLVSRVVIMQVLQRARQADMLTETIVVVGATERAEMVINSIRGTEHSNIKILGVFDDRVERQLPVSLRSQMLGSTNTLLTYIRHHRVDRVVVALPWVATARIEALLKKLRTVPVRIDLVPSNVVWQFPAINMERLAGVPVLTVANGRVDEQMGLLKRLEDLVISIILLVLLSPILLVIALVIKLDSPGPVIFRQKRHGFNNQVFEVYKFRSMTVEDSASSEVKQATKNDRRVTRVGRVLRRSSLDELPQLFNVLFGHMSIVGPRPHAIQHNLEFGAIILEYFGRHNVKPGITGWAQVNGLRGETDTVEKMHRRVEYDLHYIENWSLMLDLKILVMTAFAVWFQETAY